MFHQCTNLPSARTHRHSTVEKYSSRQSGSASHKVNMLKYQCCWMQHCKWVCMLKFEQTSSKVRLSGSQQGFWKFEEAMGHQHPHWALLGQHLWSPRPHVPHSTMSMHYWLHWMLHRITHIQNFDQQFFIYLSCWETINWEPSGFSTFTKCHFTSIQQWTWIKWSQLLLSSSQLLDSCTALSCLCPTDWTQQRTRYRFKTHRNNVVCCERNKTLLGSFSFFQEEWKHNTQHFSRVERF